MRPGSYIKDHMYHILFWTAGIFLADGTVFLFDGSSVLIGFLTAIFAGTGGLSFIMIFRGNGSFMMTFWESWIGLMKNILWQRC